MKKLLALAVMAVALVSFGCKEKSKEVPIEGGTPPATTGSESGGEGAAGTSGTATEGAGSSTTEG